MAKDVILPALGMAQESGKILEWLKAEGDAVAAGEPIAVIETDKATVDLEAPASGVLAAVSAGAGEDVPVGRVIAVILTPAEATARPTAGPEPRPPASAPHVAAAAAPSAQPAAPPGSPEAGPHGQHGRPLASPKARRLAAERGQDLVAISGSGPGGAVLAVDVLAAAGPVAPDAPSAGGASAPLPATLRYAEELGERPSPAHAPEMGTVWRLMAERTTQSWTNVPHFFLSREVSATQLIAWRERLLRQSADPITYTDLLVKVVAEALQQHPRLNARWENDTIAFNDEINVGLAVAVEDGLVVPVIHQADGLSLSAIAKRRNDLVTRAQAGKLRLRDLQDGTFTISNLGMYGVDAFTAIVNAPQAAILAVGRIVERVVPMEGQPVVQPMMTLSLSCDHRVVDGARGAQFLATVADFIERPAER
jgi:pyruvate dehydrogenase E2 component (dihydrolipoamide acetyltransferase)